MRQKISTFVGKTVKKVAKARGGGSALPGLVVEKIDPDFMTRTLKKLPSGIALVTGTNGKTTTTKIVVELLESQGLKVFTNRTGSNFTRGVAAALLDEVDGEGNLDADIAVLELDEAYAVHFARKVNPDYSLLLNVMRDQLDRFGEIDKTAELLHIVAQNTKDGVVVNRDDPRLGGANFVTSLDVPLRSFGVHPKYLSLFPSDDSLRGGEQSLAKLYADDVSLEDIDEQKATIAFSGKDYAVNFKLRGVHNMQNATAAIALTRLILGDKLNVNKMLSALEKIKPAFGRGEQIIVDGQPCELVLVKNPSGFRLSLKSAGAKNQAIMIAINDNYADGRDMSWLWDVNFESLPENVEMISGARAFDMALRLQYDEIGVKFVEPDLRTALKKFLNENSQRPKRIYCTYTAMLALRRELANFTEVDEI